ncbi:MAG TPA: hypothetical protein VHC70_10745 [Phycisphaerales bacterium]|jgi:hypothetical protein|nr:hypothetical protein [Phycisphaerales bacterium]
MTNREKWTAAAFATNLVAAITWLLLCGAAGVMCFANFADGIAPSIEPRAIILVPASAIFALLWMMLSIHTLVRPGVFRSGRWYMTGIAITLVVVAWTGWLHGAAWYGAAATMLAIAAAGMNIWLAPSGHTERPKDGGRTKQRIRADSNSHSPP